MKILLGYILSISIGLFVLWLSGSSIERSSELAWTFVAGVFSGAICHIVILERVKARGGK